MSWNKLKKQDQILLLAYQRALFRNDIETNFDSVKKIISDVYDRELDLKLIPDKLVVREYKLSRASKKQNYRTYNK